MSLGHLLIHLFVKCLYAVTLFFFDFFLGHIHLTNQVIMRLLLPPKFLSQLQDLLLHLIQLNFVLVPFRLHLPFQFGFHLFLFIDLLFEFLFFACEVFLHLLLVLQHFLDYFLVLVVLFGHLKVQLLCQQCHPVLELDIISRLLLLFVA